LCAEVASSPHILDVGCGRRKTPGAVGVDHDPKTDADIIHDLDRFPWPFENDAFDRIICSHILEHLDDVVGTMKELHRIARSGGRILILTPHYTNRCSYADPTHRHHFSVQAFDPFVISELPKWNFWQRVLHRVVFFFLEYWGVCPQLTPEARFRKVSQRLQFSRIFRWMGVEAWANRYPLIYEYYAAFVFPARDIALELEAVK